MVEAKKKVDNFDVQALQIKLDNMFKIKTLAIEQTENLNNTTQRCM